MHWIFLFDTINNIPEGIISNDMRDTGGNEKRKSLVPADRAMQGFWQDRSTPGLGGPWPAPISLSWGTGHHLVSVGGILAALTLHIPVRPQLGPCFTWAAHPWSSFSLHHGSGKRIYTRDNLSCFFWRGENLETCNSSKRPMKIANWLFVHSWRNPCSQLFADATACMDTRLPGSSIPCLWSIARYPHFKFVMRMCVCVTHWWSHTSPVQLLHTSLSASACPETHPFPDIWKILEGILPYVRVTLSEKYSNFNFLYKIESVWK